MSDIQILNKLINKEYDFCCLCFDNSLEKVVYFDDEVVCSEIHSQNNLKISEILSCVLGEEIFRNLSSFEVICVQCATAAINSYRFKKATKENLHRLINILNLVSTGLDNIPEVSERTATLFVSLSPENNTTSQFFSKTKCKTINDALNYYSITRETKSKETTVLPRHEKNPSLKNVSKKDASDFQCKECFSLFRSQTTLKSHYLRIHAPKKYKCEVCSKSFGAPGLLITHKLESHNSGLVCIDCGKVFNNRNTLKAHEKSHYLQLVCQKCGRVYKNQSTYKKHIENEICGASSRRTQADAKFECDYCHKRYSQKITLRVHIQYEHGNYKYLHCNWCNKKFWCKSRLNAHIVKHTKERNFTCEICNGKFVTKESLLYHTRIHTGEKPYKCPHCDSRFLNASRRAVHVKTQHMDATIQCNICQAKFKSYHYLLKHKRLHEEQEDQHQELETNANTNIENTEKVLVAQLDNNVKLEYQEHGILNPNTDGTECIFEYNNADQDSSEQVYIEVTTDVMKVSDNVDVQKFQIYVPTDS